MICSNCKSDQNGPAPRSFDMDLPTVVLCNICTLWLAMGETELFEKMAEE